MTVSHDGPSSLGTGLEYRSGVLDEGAPDDILVDLDTECTGDLLGNLPTTEAEVSPLHLDDRVNQFF
jgi:hypothetical protein